MVVVTLDQQCNTGEKPIVMLYTYYLHIINRHAGTPDKNKTKILFLVHKKIPYVYNNMQ